MRNSIHRQSGIPKVILIIAVFSLLGLALPFILVFVINLVGRFRPDGTILQYEGMTAIKGRDGIYKLNIEAQYASTFFVQLQGNPKAVRDIDSDDLVQLGFTRDGIGFMKLYNPIYSSASVDSKGKLVNLYLVHVEEARVPFSASPNGPFLELPVSREEFEKQFGKPLSTRYSYPNPNDPR